MTPHVLIVGAGPTGLLLACELRRLGIEVLVADPKRGPTRESRAMFVQARSLEIYDQLGIGDEAVRKGRPAESLSLWAGRTRLGVLELGRGGAGRTPYPFILAFEQSANEELLYRHLQSLGGEVAWGWALDSGGQDSGGQDSGAVTAKLSGPNGERREVEAQYLCGADGAHSPVRHEVGTAFEGENSPRALFVADVTATGRVDRASVNVKLSAASLLLAFPTTGQDHFRLIGMARGDELAGASPTFEAVRPLVRADFGVEVSEVRWFSHYKVSHRVARRFQKGRVFLLGDAAHVHSPVGGQGMNTGLGDAHNLSWKLAAVVRGEADPELLASYELERRPFAVSLVRTTDRFFRLISGDGMWARLARGRLVPAILGRLLGDADQNKADQDSADQNGARAERPNLLSEFAFGVLSQLRLHYPGSPLSVGRAGRVGGGQRLPYVEGSGNFDALRDARLQLHVYGAVSPELLAWSARHPEIPLRAFAFSAGAAKQGLMEGAAYLVRPDGYVGYAGRRPTARDLDAYLRNCLRYRL